MHVLFTGGGTLGPVTPLLAVATALRASHSEIKLSWIGTSDGPERQLVEAAGLFFYAIPSGKLRRYFAWRNLTDLFRITTGYFAALRLLWQLRPDVVASAGGFVAVPVIWAAWTLRIPAHVHQQDFRPGLANRLSLPFARSVSVSLEKSLADFPKDKTVWTGNPVRSELFAGSREAAAHRFGLSTDRPIVLAFGGGTGAASLNGLLAAAASRICASAQLLHLTGRNKSVKGSGDTGVKGYRQFEFLAEDMRHALAAADLVVTRAGMGALSELAALSKSAIIVPISGSHQEENAQYFAAAGAGLVLAEKTLTPERLAAAVTELLADGERLARLAAAMKRLARPDAAARLAELLVRLAARK